MSEIDFADPDSPEAHGGWFPPEPPVPAPLVLTHPIASLRSLIWLSVVAGVMAAALIVVDVLLLDGAPPAVDVTLLERFTEPRTEASIAVARILTHLGDLWVVVVVSAVLVVAARRRAGRWDSAWLVMTVTTGALVITAVAKELTDRARPDGALVEAISFAFPSGHASRAAAVYGLVVFLAVAWGRTLLSRIGVSVLAVAMAVATGISRLILGVHWPSDVLVGWLVGAAWLLAVLLVLRPFRHGVPHKRRSVSRTHPMRSTIQSTHDV